MSERRMAEIVRQAKRLGKIFVEAKRARHRPANLSNFDTVGEADAEMVAVRRHENLRLVPQAPESDGMNDPVAVALEDVARTARGRVRLAMETAARRRRLRRDAWRKLHSVPSGTI
jgi:hypothetical protein